MLVGSPRRTGPVGSHGQSCLYSRPRTDRTLRRPLFQDDFAIVGRYHPRLDPPAAHGLLLLRQRPEKRSAPGCPATPGIRKRWRLTSHGGAATTYSVGCLVGLVGPLSR